MFHRRLALISGAVLVVTLGLGAQLSWLTVVQGADHRATAQKRLDLVTILPTERGRILDRHGRVLAVDRPSYDVAIHYQAITGFWALSRAASRARDAHRRYWDAMSPDDREAAVALELPALEARLAEVWTAVMVHGGLDRPELDRRLDAIKQEVESTAAVVWNRQLLHLIKFSERGADEFRPRPIREQRQAHVILARVEDTVAFAFRRLAEELPGVVEVQDSHRRVYPWNTAEVTLDRSTLPKPLRSSSGLTVRVEGVADHVLGRMRDDVWAADFERRPFSDRATGRIVDRGGYRVGDAVGARGMERIYEDHLRGLRGVIRERLDTREQQRDPRRPGLDLQLTIDIALQARVQGIQSPEFGLTRAQQYQGGWDSTGRPIATILPPGMPMNSAAVVLDVETAEILALVSMPTIARGLSLPDECQDGHQLWYNRPADAIYPPGSIIKPLVLAAAVTEGVHDPDDAIECIGHHLPERQDILRCWIYRPPQYATHGRLRAEEAIARSCNLYFYTLADKLGMDRLVDWYGRFGLGTPLDIGLGMPVAPEHLPRWKGRLPDLGNQTAIGQRFGSLRFATASLAIGQGLVIWTPVHAAHAYATLARGGEVRTPTLVRDDTREATPTPLGLDEQLVATILEGLRQSVQEEHGTGHHIRYADGRVEPILNVPGITAWAKTGTAQAPPLRADLDCDGVTESARVDPSHAWFVGLVGPSQPQPATPRYAIAVVVEYGGSGGRTAGPIANEIVRALVAEGYLPDVATEGSNR